jgi:hypothetical protein
MTKRRAFAVLHAGLCNFVGVNQITQQGVGMEITGRIRSYICFSLQTQTLGCSWLQLECTAEAAS